MNEQAPGVSPLPPLDLDTIARMRAYADEDGWDNRVAALDALLIRVLTEEEAQEILNWDMQLEGAFGTGKWVETHLLKKLGLIAGYR